MALFIGTAGDDDFVATGGPDRFMFGENEGIDLIVGFDPFADKIVYTDRSVDGFNDIEASAFTINGVASTVIESNDQVTVLYGVEPFQLSPDDFVFANDPNLQGDFADAFDDLDDFPSDFPLVSVEGRAADLLGQPDGGTRIAPGLFVEPQVIVDGNGDTELAVFFSDADGNRIAGYWVREDSELNQSPVVTALDGNGRFAIAWEFADDDDPEDGRVLVRVYEFDGARLTQVSSTKAIGSNDNRHDDPAIATLEDGGFVVVAENDRDGTVVAQAFTADGAYEGPRVVVGEARAFGAPQVAAVDGGYLVAWRDADGIERTASFDADGSPLRGGDPLPEPDPQPEPEPDPLPDPEPDPSPQPEPEPEPELDDRPAIEATLTGTNGKDKLSGSSLNDLILGAAGNDTLRGNGGDDVLSGGSGKDRLAGGSGEDAFVLTADTERAVVLDYEIGTDVLVFEGTGADEFSDLRVSANKKGDAVIRFDDARVVLKGVDASELTDDDVVFTDNGDWLG